VERLVGEVLPAADLPPSGGRLIDVGSGNGSPGLVLAVLRPDLRVTLLEPRTRRWAFLRESVRHLDRPDVEVLRVRHDGYGGLAAGTVTLRGLALPLPALAPLVEPGGRLVFFGTRQQPARPPFEEERPAGSSSGGFQVFRRGSPPEGCVPHET
jgi:16S rRNA G527 N7-methylase RsmG